MLLFLPLAPQGSGEEEDLDEDDSLSEDSGSELQDDLQDDSEQSFGKSQPATPSPSPPATPRPTRRRRKPRSPSFSDDENRPPSPKVADVAIDLIYKKLNEKYGNWYFYIKIYSPHCVLIKSALLCKSRHKIKILFCKIPTLCLWRRRGRQVQGELLL